MILFVSEASVADRLHEVAAAIRSAESQQELLQLADALDALGFGPAVQSSGAEMIAVERLRHATQEGWTPDHDDTHTDGSLAGAAAALAIEHTDGDFLWVNYHEHWIAALRDKHVSTPVVRRLVIAGSLIAAEIDRLLRIPEGQA